MKLFIAALALLAVASSADSSLQWLEELKEDVKSRRNLQGGGPPWPTDVHLGSIFSLIPVIAPYETPLAIRWTSLIDAIFWNCVASYSDVYKDALTLARPVVQGVPSGQQTVANKLDCGLNGLAIFLTMALPEGVPLLTTQAAAFGKTLEFNKLDGVEACDGSASCLSDLAKNEGYDPVVVGNIVGTMVAEYAFSDGWNQLGTDGCTANCRAYADTTGYDTYHIRTGSRKFLRWRRVPWQQLTETDGNGFFYDQEHVTPHIGKTGVSRFLSDADRQSRKMWFQRYDYKAEIQLLLKRMRKLDDKRKMEIEFHDNKLEIAANAYISFLRTYRPDYDTAMRFLVAYTGAEYDSTLVVWKEKVRQNMVRPTTLIKWKRGKIHTWAGPGKGVQSINAEDFEAYIRVMPHAEFPSGSSCLCQSVEEFVSGFLQEQTGETDNPLPFLISRAAGSSRVEPGVVPASDMAITYANISEVALNCAYTRLDGGMHFTAAVPKGQKLCKGIGEQGYQYSRLLAGLND